MAEAGRFEDYKLDWVSRHDPESENYPIRSALTVVAPVNVSWRTPVVPLDQGREGACVGFGWTHEALTTPVAVDLSRLRAAAPDDPTQFALHVYREAQKIDEWAGEAYEGTSVLAGAKIMRTLGVLYEYRWCFGVNDVALALSAGPVVLGIPWYEGMYYPQSGVVKPSGVIVGGHCLLVTKYRAQGAVFPDEPALGLYNSWGPEWGNNGHAWIRQSDLAFLLRQDGEACVPMRRSYGR